MNREFTKFSELSDAGIIDRRVIDNLVTKSGIHTMTDVQRMTINECLDGTDVVAQARTGTGKTLAFLMPIVQRMLSDPNFASKRPQIGDTRALIISPTRELAEQIAAEAKKIVQGTRIQIQTAVGGTQKQYHLRLMQRMGCHILVGTPGRINDLLSDPSSGVVLDDIETFVLDEADRLLSIGFADSIAQIQDYMPDLSTKDRQTLMFSATMPRSVVGLVKQTMKPDFKFVRTVDPNEAATHESVPQNVVFLPGLQNQIPAIAEIAHNAIEAHKRDPANNLPFKAIIFYSSVNEVKLAYEILKNLRDPAQRGGFFAPHPLAPCKIIEMSSQLTQAFRAQSTQDFRNAESAIMVASDVAARGMDFPNVSHVIQVGLPRDTDDYVHRVGRTGRAGKSGQGWLLLQDDEQNEFRQLANQIHAHNIVQDSSLDTAKLDMTQPSQLSPEAGKIMQFVEAGMRTVSVREKGKAYATILGGLTQSRVNRPKQTMVDMANQLAKFGWGLERPPHVSSQWISKMGFSNTRGLEVGSFERSDDEGRGDGGRRNSFDSRGRGNQSAFGNGRNGKFGQDRTDRPRRRFDDERDGFGGFNDRSDRRRPRNEEQQWGSRY